MYVHEFTNEDNLRMQIDMTKVEAVIELIKGTAIITSNDSYKVNESFDDVSKVWICTGEWLGQQSS